jgi:hypothetical protein
MSHDSIDLRTAALLGSFASVGTLLVAAMTPHIDITIPEIFPASNDVVTPPLSTPIAEAQGVANVTKIPVEAVGGTILATPIIDNHGPHIVTMSGELPDDVAQDFADRLKELGAYDGAAVGEEVAIQVVPEYVLDQLQDIQRLVERGVPVQDALAGHSEEVREFYEYATRSGMKVVVTNGEADRIVKINFGRRPGLN